MNIHKEINPIKVSAFREGVVGDSLPSMITLWSVFYMKKKCGYKDCGKWKDISEFYIAQKAPDGLQHYCKECTKALIKRERETVDGLLRRMYNNQKANAKRRGMPPPTYPFSWFKCRALANPMYREYYRIWVEAGKPRHLTPSYDRIDNNESYTENNIQLTTWGENKKRQHQDIVNGDYVVKHERAVIIKKGGVFFHRSHSVHDAGKITGVGYRNVSACCRGLRKSGKGFTFEYE